MPLILLDEPPEAEDWVSLSVEVPLLLFFFVLPLELSADWSLEDAPFALPDFWPERVAAGVLVAFSCARPELLMCDCALSSPVDFEVELPVSLEDVLGEEEELVELGVDELLDELGLDDVEPEVPEFIEDEPLVPEVDAAPLYCDDELADGLWVLPLLYVDEVVVPSVLGAFLLLCMSPSASAEPLASTMMDEKKTGASLRMWGLLMGWLVKACRKARCKLRAIAEAALRGVNAARGALFTKPRQKKCRRIAAPAWVVQDCAYQRRTQMPGR